MGRVGRGEGVNLESLGLSEQDNSIMPLESFSCILELQFGN